MKHSFIRFLLVGVINTIVGLSIMYLLFHGVHLSYWMSTFLGNMGGAGVSFVLNRKFTFKSGGSIYGSIVRFIIVMGACYFISYSAGLNLASWILESVLRMPQDFAHDFGILAGTGIYTILNYFGQKIIVFPVREKGLMS